MKKMLETIKEKLHLSAFKGRWNEYMQDVLELEMDPVTGAQPKMMQMFFME